MGKEITRRKFMQGAATIAPLALAAPAFAQTAASSRTQAGGDKWDVVVVGAGHNSLVTACYMQMAGFRCVVLEGRPQIGGGAKTAELTLRGFKHDVCSANHSRIPGSDLYRELKLKEYGYEILISDPVNTMVCAGGECLTVWQDLDRTVAGIAKLSKKDADTWARMAKESSAFRALDMDEAFDDGAPLGWLPPKPEVARKLSAAHLRRSKMSKWAVINHTFEHPHVRTLATGGWPVGLNADNTGLSAFPSAKPSGPATPKGGSGMISVALGRCFEAHGGVILTNKPAVELIVEGGKCVGVTCGDGSQYRASKAVVSTVHIKRLVDMAPKEMWGDEFLDGVSTFQTGSSGLNTLYACKEPILFPETGGTGLVDPPPVHARTNWSMERALRFDMELMVGDVNPDDPEPVLHIVQPSVIDPSRAPAGFHTVRVLGRQPFNLRDGGPERWDEIKERVADSHLRAIQRVAKNFTDDKILGRFILSPVDLERQNPGMYHGSCHGGTDGPAQSGELRPVPGWAQHRMPIPGLYQTGGTTHPGGGVGGRPGRNAAMVILKDFGTSIEEAVTKT